MADLTASKKKNKAQLWEEAKRKEEEEAKNRLMRFRLQEAEELSRANLTADALVKAPESSIGVSPRGPVERKLTAEKPAEAASTPAPAPAADPAPAPAPAAAEPAAAPVAAAAASAPAPAPAPAAAAAAPLSARPDNSNKLEEEVRVLRTQLSEAISAKVEALQKVRDLERAVHDADERAQEQIRKLEREVAQLKKDLAAARATPAPLSATSSSDNTAAAAAAAAPAGVTVTVTPDDKDGSDEEKGGEGARLGSLTSGRAAPSRRKPASRRPASSYEGARKEEGEKKEEKKEKKEDGGGSLLAQAAQAQKEAKAQADRERALARQKELAGGPRTSDIAHMAVSSPVQLRASTSERTASPSVFGDKVKAAIAQEDRLILVKGRKRIRSRQVPMARESLNSGDVFLLETRSKIFHWNGKKSSRPERTKGVDLSNRLKRTYGSRMEVVQMDEGKTDDEAEFWKALGGRGDVKEEAAGGDDGDFEKEEDERNKLYRINEKLEIVAITETPLKKEQLVSDGVFVLDCGNEFYLWHGKRSDNNLRRDAMAAVMDLFGKQARPEWACIRKMLEDGEPPLFEEKFSNWPDSFEKVMAKSGATSNVAASKAGTKGDASRMWQEIVRGEQRMADDGTGRIEIWSVDKLSRGAEATKTPLAQAMYGQFFSKNSYVVLYTYGTADARSYILYFWQGRDCGTNEKAAAAGLVMKMQEQYRGATQVRVPQQKEPAHFLLIFKGNLVIRQGDFAKASDEAVELYQVKGSAPENSRTVQAQARAEALNSHSAYVLQNKEEQWVWIGEHANDFEKAKAAEVAALLRGSRTSRGSVAEGAEPESFWQQLGGKSDYATKFPHKPRFFQGDNARGFFTADEVLAYTQDDLDSAQLAIVDTVAEVFVWAGNDSREADKKAALELAVDYNKAATDGRSPETPVLLIYEFSEPLRFTRHFQGWQPRKAAKKSFSKKNLDVGAAPAEKKEAVKASEVLSASVDQTFPYEQLKAKRDLPPGIDLTKLEQYLSADEFKKVFNMTKEEYNALPGWKRLPMRKTANLF